LIAAVVLTGFAGAAIAAEIGTMVVGEEIEALEAHALNPVRFLVIPRVLASVVSMTCLGVIADVVAITAGLMTAMVALDIPYATYVNNLLDQVKPVDFWTGIGKGSIFGLLIGIIACGNGLQVTGGAAGVARRRRRPSWNRSWRSSSPTWCSPRSSTPSSWCDYLRKPMGCSTRP
jgi:phospholipid/cholesterol/gamma-HCH transport system permease protein